MKTANPVSDFLEGFKEQPAPRKEVNYFYPTSDNAKRFKMPNGGWNVSVMCGHDWNTHQYVGAFSTEVEAMQCADALPFEWSKATLYLRAKVSPASADSKV